MNPFLQRLAEQPLLFDGAMGTMLYARGASSEQCLEALVDRPARLGDRHPSGVCVGGRGCHQDAHLWRQPSAAGASRAGRQGPRVQLSGGASGARCARGVGTQPVYRRGHRPGGQARGSGTTRSSATRSTRRIASRSACCGRPGPTCCCWRHSSDVVELETAVRVAKELCDLPIVASMTFAEDGLTLAGQSAEQVTQRLLAAGVDVVGDQLLGRPGADVGCAGDHAAGRARCSLYRDAQRRASRSAWRAGSTIRPARSILPSACRSS